MFSILPNKGMKYKEWFAFGLLGLIWGSSFLWIKIAIREIGPFTLVAFRLLFGLVGLLAVLYLRREPLPRQPRVLLAFLFMGVFNTALPFTLISWGETRIDSALASILNGTVPLFTIVIAHLWLHDEKITLPRMTGLVAGFIGVAVLVSRDLGPASSRGDFWGQAAVLVAASSYALAMTFSRKYLRGQSPLVQATMVVFLADAMLWFATLAFEPAFLIPRLPATWFALLWLGLFGSCVAYLLYFYLINAWGATRASLVSYVFPVVGLILGIIFLGEVADWRLVIASIFIVGGIVVVNFKPQVAPAQIIVRSDKRSKI